MTLHIPPVIAKWSPVTSDAIALLRAATLCMHGEKVIRSYHEADALRSFMRLADALGYDVTPRPVEAVQPAAREVA